MPLADGTLLIASDGSRQLDATGTARMASATDDSCCCDPCPYGNTCDPDAIPASVVIDITNVDLGGCPGNACSPDDDAEQPASIDYLCSYRTDVDTFVGFCWDGKKVAYVDLRWNAGTCRWMGYLAIFGSEGDGGIFSGASNNPADPTGTYTWTSGCATGSFEVS